MKLIIRSKALKALEKIALYVESINTRGSGDRFLVTFLGFIKQYAVPGVMYQPCNHHTLASNGYYVSPMKNG